MKRHFIGGVALFLVILLCVATPVEAKKKKVVLNKTKESLELSKKATLKVKNAKGKVKWRSSNKEVASVSKGKVTAKKLGKTVITAKVGKKKYICKITVTMAKKDEVKASKMVYENTIFTKEMLKSIVGIKGRFEGTVKDKKAIQAAFSKFAATKLSPIPEPEEALYGHSTYEFIMENGSKITAYTVGDHLIYDGQRYKMDTDFEVQLNGFLKKYAV